MNGLLLKDMLVIKSQGKIIFVILLIYIIMTVANDGNITMFDSMGTMITSMFAITAMAYDERAEWNRYALTMPVSRKSLVLSKYAISLTGPFIILLFSLLLSLFINKSVPIDDVRYTVIIFSAGVSLISFILPLAIKFGVEKGRLFIMLVVLIPFILVFLLYKFIPDVIVAEQLTEVYLNYIFVIPVTAIILFILSLLISIRIIEKKEF